MKKGEQKKKQDVDCLDYKVIWTTILCTLVSLLLVLCFIFIGIKMAGGKVTFVAEESDITVRQVEAESFRLDYTLDDSQIAKDDKAAYIFNDLDAKNKANNYVVIESKTQLDNLLNTYEAVSGQKADADIDASFFDTGSVLAIAVEDKAFATVSMPSITRDASYNLTATIDATRLTDEEIDSLKTTTSTLFLVRVQNITPENVEVQFNEN